MVEKRDESDAEELERFRYFGLEVAVPIRFTRHTQEIEPGVPESEFRGLRTPTWAAEQKAKEAGEVDSLGSAPSTKPPTETPNGEVGLVPIPGAPLKEVFAWAQYWRSRESLLAQFKREAGREATGREATQGSLIAPPEIPLHYKRALQEIGTALHLACSLLRNEQFRTPVSGAAWGILGQLAEKAGTLAEQVRGLAEEAAGLGEVR